MIQQGQHGPAVQLDDAPKAEEATKSDDAADMLPASGTGPTLFKASFSGNDLLGLAHEKLGWVPPMSLSFAIGWSVDPAGSASLTSARATWGVLPGVLLQAGSGVGLDWKPTVTGPEGQVSTIMKTLPAQPAIGSAALGAAPENR